MSVSAVALGLGGSWRRGTGKVKVQGAVKAGKASDAGRSILCKHVRQRIEPESSRSNRRTVALLLFETKDKWFTEFNIGYPGPCRNHQKEMIDVVEARGYSGGKLNREHDGNGMGNGMS